MSLAAKRLLKRFRRENYKQTVMHSFLHPNQKKALFSRTSSDYRIHQINSGQVVTIDPVESPKAQILYFHGGAFTVPMNADQLEMVTRIATAANCRLQIADFPLLPEYSSADILDFAQLALTYVSSPEQHTFLVADSAGVAIALQLLINNPEKVAGASFISPWLDMQLNDPAFKSREAEDVMLSLSVLKQIGVQFVAGLQPGQWRDVFDPRNLAVGDLQLFYGQNELLVPTNLKIIDVLNQVKSGTTEVYEFRDGFHDYPLWFKLPETKKTFKKITSFITSRYDA